MRVKIFIRLDSIGYLETMPLYNYRDECKSGDEQIIGSSVAVARLLRNQSLEQYSLLLQLTCIFRTGPLAII